MYSLADYLWMIADRARVAAYSEALRALIRPGARVLDIGAGFGFFSVIAAKAGARHVDAVETNPVVHLGPKVAAANGCADRIRFHHQDAALVTLDEPADLLIADLRGPTPFGPRALETIVGARRRLLRPDAVMVARRDTLFVAPTEAPGGVRREIDGAQGAEDVVLDPVERVVRDTPMRFPISAGDLLADGQPWLELDYRFVDSTEFGGGTACELRRRGRVEGLAVWFEADLGAGVTFSTAPASEVVAYRQMFIPLRVPFDVSPGDRLRIRLHVRQMGRACVWEWQIWMIDRETAIERHVCRQNSMAEMIVDPAAFVPTATHVRPSVGPRGRALRHLLEWMEGRETVAALATRLQETAPDLFRNDRAALDFVAEWTDRMQRHERNAD